MFLRLARIAMIAVLCASLGAHWAALQSVAWTMMIVTNAGHESLGQSVSDTFDGKHPCAFCKHIAAAKRSQTEKKAPQAAPRFDLIGNPCDITILTFCSDVRFPPLEVKAFRRQQLPPTPPPRCEPA